MMLNMWQLILSPVFSMIILILEMVVSMQPHVQKAALTPVLYLPSIAQPSFIQVGPISRFRRARTIDLLIRGEITSTFNIPIYQTVIRVTGYDISGKPYRVVTTTPFLPVTFPGQINGLQAIFEDGLMTEAIKVEVISWTFTSTQSYLSPTVMFTSSINGVSGFIFNHTGVTLTNVIIAAWSIKDADASSSALVVPVLAPSQTVSFVKYFDTNYLVTPESVRVGAQGIVSP